MKTSVKFLLIFALLAVTVLSFASVNAMGNPFHVSSRAEILEEVGLDLPAPDFANSAAWFYIDGTEAEPQKTAQLDFTVDEIEYCYRIRPAGLEMLDISGMYCEWTHTKEVKVLYNDATVSWNEDGSAKIEWFDIVPGLVYCLSVEENADVDKLVEIAGLIYTPTQGDAG